MGIWRGNCVNNCTGAKYILLLEDRMEKNNVTFSESSSFSFYPFYFDAQ